MTSPSALDAVIREHIPTVLGALVRRFGDFDTCEDAVQEALLSAAIQWPRDGVPANPKAWLIRVASRRRIEAWRSDTARRRREEAVAQAEPVTPSDGASGAGGSEEDDTLTLFLLCCHPSLTPASQVALTLRAMGGLTTAEIARALLVPEPTVAQRISRAKASIREAGARFELPPPEDRPQRLAALLHVLYLVFNEGYTASSGSRLVRVELTDEAIRLARQLHVRLPDDGEVAGLLALLLLTDARRPARSTRDGALVPLGEQDRDRWNRVQIEEGVVLITAALASRPIGPYQLQAAIAAVHDEAATAADTDWRQILALYDHLRILAPGPMVTLNRIVAVAMVHGPATALAELAGAESDPVLAAHHRLAAVRAHLLELAGDLEPAAAEYRRAAELTLSRPERRYLVARAERLAAARKSNPAG